MLPKRFAAGIPICYAVGVGEDVDFERRLSDRGAAKQRPFDPTPRTGKFMADPRNTVAGATFVAIGVWKEDCVQTFHASSNLGHVSHSIVVDTGSASGGFIAECRTIRSVMRHDRIDVFKLNVEGAEDAILQSALNPGVRPSAILVTYRRGMHGLRRQCGGPNTSVITAGISWVARAGVSRMPVLPTTFD